LFFLHRPASYSDASYSSDEEDGGINPREKEQVSFVTTVKVNFHYKPNPRRIRRKHLG